MNILTDICYSTAPHGKSYLDIYLPDGDIRGIFVFLHGGGLSSGGKWVPNPEYMTGQGFAAVCPNYRLYPDARFPDFLLDAAEACAWVKNNPQRFNGCDKIFIGGSSAGGYLSMMLYFDGQYLGKHGLSCKDFAGFVFDAGQPTVHFNVLRERGLDHRRIVVDEAAPLYHISGYTGEPPMMIYVAENDIPNRYAQTQLLLSTLKDFGYPEEHITYHFMPGCKHCSYTASMGFSKSVADFMDKYI